ncbi:hypothetical protein F2Q70_00025877 [Brassica cretica]|uniref:Uncharacterized protein n=1 Tax=Brassica cretica TaxID=69181 RepID=A0A8S9L7S3_BRACR|nr:hypothetical protein F2Q70_00025877 [Brassica cretica]
MKLDGVYYPLNDNISWLTTCLEEMKQDIARIQHATDVARPPSIDRRRPPLIDMHHHTSIDNYMSALIDDSPPCPHTTKSQQYFHTREEINQLVEEIYRALETTEERLDGEMELVEIQSYIARRPEASLSIDRRNNISTNIHHRTSVDDATNRGRLVLKITSDMSDTHYHGEEISGDTYATLRRHQFNLENLEERLQRMENTTVTMKKKWRRGDETMGDFTEGRTKEEEVNYIGGTGFQVVKEEKLQEGHFEVESLMSFGGSQWCRSTPDLEHRSTYTSPNRSTGTPEHRSMPPTESTMSCNAVKILTHEEFAAKHPHPPNPDKVRIARRVDTSIDRHGESSIDRHSEAAIDRQPPAPIDRRAPITYRVQMPKIDVARLNTLRPKPKPSEHPPEPIRTPSDDGEDPMEEDRVPTGRTLRRIKEKVAKHLKRGANDKEKESFWKRVLRIPIDKPFEVLIIPTDCGCSSEKPKRKKKTSGECSVKLEKR